MSTWKPRDFNWHYVLTSPSFSPSMPFIWAAGVGMGLLLGWTMPWALVVLGLLALLVLTEWTYNVAQAARRERQRVRSARKHD